MSCRIVKIFEKYPRFLLETADYIPNPSMNVHVDEAFGSDSVVFSRYMPIIHIKIPFVIRKYDFLNTFEVEEVCKKLKHV